MTTEEIGWGALLEYGDPEHLVVFVSGWGREGQQTFHFKGFGDSLPQTKLYLRDHGNCHYTQGIKGVSENQEDSEEFLGYFIDKIGADRVTFVSGSLGTHASMIWGHHLGVDDIHIVGPVTHFELGLERGRAYHPAFAEAAELGRSLMEDGFEYHDLRPLMQKHSKNVTCVDLYYGLDDEMDMEQANNIEDLPHVRSTVYHRGDHFRVPMFVQRRDPILRDRINAKTVDKPAELRRKKNTDPVELGYASVRLM